MIKLKRGNKSSWESKNPYLQDGQPGFVTDESVGGGGTEDR